MIEYHLQTGLQNDSDDYYIYGIVNQNIGSIEKTDKFTNHIYINGQSLLEDNFVETKLNQQISLIEHSGDFYLKDSVLRNSGGFYDFSGTNLLLFDKMQSGKRPFFESNSFSGLITGFSGQVLNTLSGDLVFINGIKLTSGENYIEDNNGNFQWIDSSEDFGGIIFSIPNSSELTITGVYDVYNEFFLKGTSLSYLNGVKLNNDEFLETCTSVGLIQTGLQPEIEFSPKSIETIINF
jgi:hypothetical protein